MSISSQSSLTSISGIVLEGGDSCEYWVAHRELHYRMNAASEYLLAEAPPGLVRAGLWHVSRFLRSEAQARDAEVFDSAIAALYGDQRSLVERRRMERELHTIPRNPSGIYIRQLAQEMSQPQILQTRSRLKEYFAQVHALSMLLDSIVQPHPPENFLN